MDEQQEDVGGRIPGKLDEKPAHHRANHLAHVLGDYVQRHGVDNPVPAHDVENACSPGRVFDGLGSSLDKCGQEDVPRLNVIQVVNQ